MIRLTKVDEILGVINKVLLALSDEVITLLETRDVMTKDKIIDSIIDLYKGQKETWRMLDKIFEGYKKVQDEANASPEPLSEEALISYFV